MSKVINWKNIMHLGLAILVIVCAWIFIYGDMLNDPEDDDVVRLEDGWTIICGEETYENVSLSDVGMDTFGGNHQAVMEIQLPETGLESPCLCFRTILSAVKVEVNGEEVYSVYMDQYEKGLLIPKIYNRVNLEGYPAGSVIKITLYSEEMDKLEGISFACIGKATSISRHFMQDRKSAIFIGTFLCFFGLVLIILTPVLVIGKDKDLSIIFCGLVSFVLGVYLMAYNDVLYYYSNNNFYDTVAEYIVLYAIPLLILGFLLTSHPKGKVRKIVELVTFLFDLIFIFTAIILQATNILHINQLVTFFHVLTLTEGILMVVDMVVVLRQESRSRDEFSGLSSMNVLTIGSGIFILCAVIDIAKYELIRTIGISSVDYANIKFTMVGAMVFVISLLMNYFFHSIDHINARQVKQRLEGLAYTDELTGLTNRARTEQIMREIGDKRYPYTVIAMDLDRLKYVNDNLGHHLGDQMLKAFSDILKDVFRTSLVIGRMGGDEFVIIWESIDQEKTQAVLESMTACIQQFNQKEREFQISVSYGIALSTENPREDAYGIYMLADSRMYDMKKQHHGRQEVKES